MEQDEEFENRLVVRIAKEIVDMLPENPERRRRVLDLVNQTAEQEFSTGEPKTSGLVRLAYAATFCATALVMNDLNVVFWVNDVAL